MLEPIIKAHRLTLPLLTDKIQSLVLQLRQSYAGLVIWPQKSATHWLPEYSVTINTQRCVETLRKLKHAIKSKCPTMLMDGIIMLHDNIHLYITKDVSIAMQKFHRKALACPSYSPHAISMFSEPRRNTFVDLLWTKSCWLGWNYDSAKQSQTFFYKCIDQLIAHHIDQHSRTKVLTVYLLFTSVSFLFDCSLQIYFINPVSNLCRPLHIRGTISACISYLEFVFLCSYWFPVLLRNLFRKKRILELIPFLRYKRRNGF